MKHIIILIIIFSLLSIFNVFSENYSLEDSYKNKELSADDNYRERNCYFGNFGILSPVAGPMFFDLYISKG